jgi:hypothetical protein
MAMATVAATELTQRLRERVLVLVQQAAVAVVTDRWLSRLTSPLVMTWL